MLVTENNALLIGKDGKNIDAIQILLRQAVCNQKVVYISKSRGIKIQTS